MLHSIAPDGLTYDPSQHELLEPGLWVSSLRGKLNEPRLFLYRHRIVETFVLAHWWRRPGEENSPGVMCEFRAFKQHPDRMTEGLPTAEEIAEHHLRPADEAYREAIGDLRAQAARKAQDKMELKERLEDRMKRIQKAVGPHRADHPDILAVGSGDSVWEPDPEND